MIATMNRKARHLLSKAHRCSLLINNWPVANVSNYTTMNPYTCHLCTLLHLHIHDFGCEIEASKNTTPFQTRQKCAMDSNRGVAT